MINSKNTDNLFWWKQSKIFGIIERRHNLGDALSPFIVNKILENHSGNPKSHKNGRKLFAIGSILNHANNADIVWGSGINGTKSDDSYKFDYLDVRAVRGPITKDFLENRGVKCPEIFGDPGILISKFIEPKPKVSRHEIFIPHFSQKKKKYSDIYILNTIGANFQKFVNEICSSKIVYSSSLHGIIISEAYGIPAILTNISDRENIIKYRDYYLGTGRDNFPIAKTIEEARLKSPPILPDIVKIQNNLLNSFPFDFWKWE